MLVLARKHKSRHNYSFKITLLLASANGHLSFLTLPLHVSDEWSEHNDSIKRVRTTKSASRVVVFGVAVKTAVVFWSCW